MSIGNRRNSEESRVGDYSGKFDYQGCFPARRNLERLGLQLVAKLEKTTSPKLWSELKD